MEMKNAPIILTATMAAADQSWANKLRLEHYPAARNHVDAHITLFHHLPPSAYAELKARIAILVKDYPAPIAHIDSIINLGSGVAFHLESPELMAVRAYLADIFYNLLMPQDRAEPRLHITIQNKVKPIKARALIAELERSFIQRPLSITGLSAFYYEGGPWSPIATWNFRVHRN
jgi:hypothetical protein